MNVELASEPTVVNGRRAVAVLSYLGFTVLLLQVGIVPLLPAMQRQFGLSAGDATWLLTTELLAGAVALAILTRLADLFGKRNIMIFALGLTLIGSILGATTDNLILLFIARALMGAQTPMLAIPEALASDTMTPPRARWTIGAIHASNCVGVGGGIALAGVISTTTSDYHAYFYFAMIIVAIALVCTLLFVRESKYRAAGRFDLLGAFLLACGLGLLLLAISKGPSWGWNSMGDLSLFVTSAVAWIIFVLHELSHQHPLIDIKTLSSLDIWLSNSVVFLIAFGIYGAITAVTRFSQTSPAIGYGFGFSPLQVAIFAVPTAIGGLLGALLLQRLGRRFEYISASGISAAFCTVAYLILAAFHATPQPMMVALAIYALGNTMGIAAAQIAVVQGVAAETSGSALGVTIVLYAIGNSLGSTVVGMLLSTQKLPQGMPTLGAYVDSFLIAGACAAVAAGACGAHHWQRNHRTATRKEA